LARPSFHPYAAAAALMLLLLMMMMMMVMSLPHRSQGSEEETP
jgi:ABC-type spermidine/putrescine transport system permease subunit I